MHVIDLNCDLGEGDDDAALARDMELLDLVSSANICCGQHAGDLAYIEPLVAAAVEKKVAVGAHPGYPDREGFGRRPMPFEKNRLRQLIHQQLATLSTLLDRAGGRLRYIKPHGALYHATMQGTDDALALIEVARAWSPPLPVMGQPRSALEGICRDYDLRFIREGFADRAYHADGSLVSRDVEGSVLSTPEAAVQQTLRIIEDETVNTSGGVVPLSVDSLCVHGDNPEAYSLLVAIRSALAMQGIQVRSVR